MTELPDSELLASLVSTVTETMCGISFCPQGKWEDDESHSWRVAMLSISGAPPLQVILSSDQKSCQGLGAALLRLPAEELESDMVDDSLCELLNMAAGQVKRALSLDQALGLPKIVPGAAGQALFKAAKKGGILLRSRGPLDLLIWVTDEVTQRTE